MKDYMYLAEAMARSDYQADQLKSQRAEIKALRKHIKQLEADLRGQVAAKHQLGLIASQYRDDLLKETAK